MTGDIEIVVHEDGSAQFVHDDDVAGLFAAEEQAIRRASHVEPASPGGWVADLSPVGGPRLGPFARRDEALEAERAWIAERMAAGRVEAQP